MPHWAFERPVPEDPHHAITERRGVPTAIWEIIFSCGYLETTERTPLAKFRHFTECPFCRADMGVRSFVENCLARADLPDLSGLPFYLEEQHRRAPDTW